ncbi:MAG: sensor domain-containing diguanylate cyclase [Treponema sp.]|nr:sensor domain-containing diguanylate cyclase [Treponema sp.]
MENSRYDTNKLQELTANYEKRIYDLEQLLDISRSFSTTLEGSKLLDSITFSCMAQMHVTNAGIFVLDLLNSEYFELQLKHQTKEQEEKFKIAFDDPIVNVLVEEKRPVQLDYLLLRCTDSPAIPMLKSLNPTLIVPLILKNHINGILYLGERFLLDPDADIAYSDYEKDQILNIASLAAISINNTALIERSSTDMMTHLKLKYFFFNVLSEKLDIANSQHLPLSVMMFDIDFFKHFNDTYGHECGDYVLKQVAHLIKSNLRDEDLASRYGGEEFTVLLTNTKKEVAMAIAERIRTSIASHDFVYNDQHMRVTISVGVAVYDYKTNPITVPKNLVNQADQGLYMSKHNGRNRVTYAPPSLVTNLEEENNAK